MKMTKGRREKKTKRKLEMTLIKNYIWCKQLVENQMILLSDNIKRGQIEIGDLRSAIYECFWGFFLFQIFFFFHLLVLGLIDIHVGIELIACVAENLQ